MRETPKPSVNMRPFLPADGNGVTRPARNATAQARGKVRDDAGHERLADNAASAPASASASRTQRGIQSVEVGGRLLRALADARGPLALSDLAASGDLPPGQAHAYLVSLTRLGLIKRDELSGRYEPGPLALRLGLLHLEHQPAFRAAVPHAAVLAQETGFSVAICIAGPQGPTIVRYEHGGLPLHVNLHVGTVMSLPGTSTGRVFCAFLPPERLQPMWTSQSASAEGSSAAQRSDNAEQDVQTAFEALLEGIRARGMERGVNAPTPGVSSLCVPVFDAHNQLCLALTAIGATGAIDVKWNGPVARAMRAAALEIGAALQSSSVDTSCVA